MPTKPNKNKLSPKQFEELFKILKKQIVIVILSLRNIPNFFCLRKIHGHNKSMQHNESRRKSVNQLIKPYPGRWVALSSDEHQVIGVATTAQVALIKAQEKGERFPHLVKAPDSSTAAFIY